MRNNHRKIPYCALVLYSVLNFTSVLAAHESDMIESPYADFTLDKSFSIKSSGIGKSLFDKPSEEKNTFDAEGWELAYEDRIKRNFAVAFAVGSFSIPSTYLDLRYDFISVTGLYNRGLSYASKIYFGLGFGGYQSDGEYQYNLSSVAYKADYDAFSIGLHFLTGFEYIFEKKKKTMSKYDNDKCGLFVEYQFIWLNEHIEKEVVDGIRNNYNISTPDPDIDEGKHMFSFGVKWHY